jgi:hypothetical protein
MVPTSRARAAHADTPGEGHGPLTVHVVPWHAHVMPDAVTAPERRTGAAVRAV